MQLKTKKALLIAVLLGAVIVVALPFTMPDSLAFLRDSGPGAKLSMPMQQPISDAALNRAADQSLQRIEAARASIGGDEYNNLDQLSLKSLESQIASLSTQEAEAPAIGGGSSRNLKFGEKQPAISDNYEPGIALDVLEKETGLNRSELESLLSEGR